MAESQNTQRAIEILEKYKQSLRSEHLVTVEDSDDVNMKDFEIENVLLADIKNSSEIDIESVKAEYNKDPRGYTISEIDTLINLIEDDVEDNEDEIINHLNRLNVIFDTTNHIMKIAKLLDLKHYFI